MYGPHRFSLRALAKFGEAREGNAIVEFALLSSVLALIVAGILNITFMIGAQRDVERASASMVRALTSCPASQGTDCIRSTIDLLNLRMPNILVGYTNPTVGFASFQRRNDEIKMCPGTMTHLETAMKNSAIQILKKDDPGALVYIQINYTSFMPEFAQKYFGATTSVFKEHTIGVLSRDFTCAS